MNLSADLSILIPRWRIEWAELLLPSDPAQIETSFGQLGQPAPLTWW